MYQILEHEADVGIKGIGNSYEEAFGEGAKGLFSVMTDLEKIEVKEIISINASALDLPQLFVEWLNQLIAEKDLQGMMFADFVVKIEKTNNGYELRGEAKGEKIDLNKHEMKTEVKGATYAGLECGQQEEGQFFCQCVVDV